MSEQTLQERLKHEHEYISDLGVTSWTLLDTIRDAAIRIDELERQLAEAQKDQADAKRYRWIESQHRIVSLDMGGKHRWMASHSVGMLRGGTFDQAIDAAMKVKP